MAAFFILSTLSYAEDIYQIDPAQSSIQCSIKYTLIGRYNARFETFGGTINFNPKKFTQSRIQLAIKTESLKSKFSTLDRMARSKRLLDAAQFPEMTFQSNALEQKEDQFFITGVFNLHGVTKELTLPFTMQGPFKDDQGRDYLLATGIWRINRKDFKVIWSQTLDHGGIIVGDTVTIRWEIVAVKK